MTKPKVAKSKRPEAERAGEWYLRRVECCVITRRALRAKFQAVDFFACDVMGKRDDGTMVFAQVTAGGDEALRQRRRKLEKIPWDIGDRVLVLQLTETPDPVNRRRKKWWFRVHVLMPPGHLEGGIRNGWGVKETAQPVPKEWFKAWKPAPEEKDEGSTDSN